MKRTLVLNYSLGSGALQPYLNGLAQGIAMARQCAGCTQASFPPLRRCACVQADDIPNMQWTRLTGLARIIYRTDGPNGSFALVQFAGADNKATCRIANPTFAGENARLISSAEGAPGITIEIMGDEIEIDG